MLEIMKTTKKLVALFMCLTLCVGLLPSLALADDEVSYLAIGDSTAQGYYTDGFTYGNMGLDTNSSPNSYPFLFHTYLEEKLGCDVKLYQYTLQGMRPNELYAILAPEAAKPYMDGFCKRHVKTFENAFKAVYDTDIYTGYMDAVRDADIITYDCGLNNFGNYLANRFMAMLSGDLGEFKDDSTSMIYDQLDAETAETCNALKATLTNLLAALLKENAELAGSFIDMLIYCYASFVLYYDKTIDIIYNENPDADLIVFGMCNNLKGLVFSLETEAGTVCIDFGSVFQTIYEVMNSHITGTNKHATQYKYVDMSGDFERIIDEIAYGEMTKATKDYIIQDIKALGYTSDEDIARGIEVYVKASQIKTLDLPSVMELLSSSDMSDCAKRCIDDYDAASVGDKAILNLYMRSTCANGFGTHPSFKGGIQKYEALVKAYESNLTASAYSAKSVIDTGAAAFNTAFQLIKAPLLEKLADIFGGVKDLFVSFLDGLRQNIEDFFFSFLNFA